jgi:catechol 2,3-dioxygenase-like lactoylglutathione lyase family enzyme
MTHTGITILCARAYSYAARYDETIAFYTDLLGGQIVGGWERGGQRGCRICLGGLELDVEEPPPGADVGIRWAGPGQGLRVEVDDLDAWFERVRQAVNVEVLDEPATYDCGGRSFRVRDPNGMMLLFCQSP